LELQKQALEETRRKSHSIVDRSINGLTKLASYLFGNSGECWVEEVPQPPCKPNLDTSSNLIETVLFATLTLAFYIGRYTLKQRSKAKVHEYEKHNAELQGDLLAAAKSLPKHITKLQILQREKHWWSDTTPAEYPNDVITTVNPIAELNVYSPMPNGYNTAQALLARDLRDIGEVEIPNLDEDLIAQQVLADIRAPLTKEPMEVASLQAYMNHRRMAGKGALDAVYYQEWKKWSDGKGTSHEMNKEMDYYLNTEDQPPKQVVKRMKLHEAFTDVAFKPRLY